MICNIKTLKELVTQYGDIKVSELITLLTK